jgi:hypothetical protein
MRSSPAWRGGGSYAINRIYLIFDAAAKKIAFGFLI